MTALHSYRLEDIEQSVAKAQRSITAYKRAVKARRELMTREEFEGEIPAKETAPAGMGVAA
jgi:hypothetical protein